MGIFNQASLVDQLNKYLSFEKRSLALKQGYCHGINLLWLHCMSTGKEQWFYDTVKKIVSAQNKIDFDVIKPSVEKLLSHIEWLQNSSNYVPTIHQTDVDKLLEVPHKKTLSFLFTREQLDDVLPQIIPNQQIVCVASVNHSIGIFKRDNQYFIFDPNYEDGIAASTTDINELKNEIIRCFYENNAEQATTFPISFIVVSDKPITKIKTNHLFEKLVSGNPHINDASYSGFTNLYFACRNGNSSEVKVLLKNGAEPNSRCMDSWTPLLIAASKGYYEISKELLKYGADVNYMNNEKHTALYLAINNGFSDLTELFLRSGANPLLTNQAGQSTIYAAVQNRDWRSTALLLFYIKNHNDISKQDIDLLHQHKNEIISSINQIASHSSRSTSEHILKMSNSIFKPGLIHRLFSTWTSPTQNTNELSSNQTNLIANNPYFENKNQKKSAS